jgi:hypothetical protein
MGEERKPSARSGCIVLAVVMLPVLYVLSVGPMARLDVDGKLPFRRIDPPYGFYAPLFWLADNCKPIDDALRTYLKLWSHNYPHGLVPLSLHTAANGIRTG